MSISLFCLQGAILSMNFHWKKGTCYVKYSRGVGCLPTWAFYTVLTFFLNGKKTNKQNIMKEKNSYDKVAWTLRPVPPFLASKSSVSCSSQNVPLCRSFNWFVIQFLVYVSFLIFEKHRKVYWHDNNEVGWRSLVVVEQVNISLWINRRVNIEPKTISMLLENVYAISVY